ncbi:MAG: MFS transporter [Halofilum sp. (in: g-proteobacteria)]|nr:MFS transporter [Halofilum sp. (in: g-proteobacteria)]
MIDALTRRLPAPGATAMTAWSVWALLLGMGMLMLGNGMQGTLLGLRASDEGFSGTVTGLVMSGYFVGFLAGAYLTPVIVQRAGHVRVFAALASIASVAILVHAMLVTPPVWGLMRILTGFAYSGLYIVTESWLNDRATNETRGSLLSVYLMITFAAMGGGQLMMNVASPSEYELFLINAIVLSLALVPILLSTNSEPEHSAPDPLNLLQLYRISPLGTVGAFATGMSQGALFGMGAVFARGYDLSVAQVSFFMAALIAGGAVLQWPIGRLSDRIDRRKVITWVGLAVVLVAAVTVPVARISNTGLVVMGVLFGGTVLPMYSLYVAYVNDHLKPKQMVAASSGLYMAVALGAVLGPSVTGWLMDKMGPNGFLWYFVAVHLGMVCFAWYRMARRPTPRVGEQVPYAFVPGRTPELAETWIEERTAGADKREGESGT